MTDLFVTCLTITSWACSLEADTVHLWTGLGIVGEHHGQVSWGSEGWGVQVSWEWHLDTWEHLQSETVKPDWVTPKQKDILAGQNLQCNVFCAALIKSCQYIAYTRTHTHAHPLNACAWYILIRLHAIIHILVDMLNLYSSSTNNFFF